MKPIDFSLNEMYDQVNHPCTSDCLFLQYQKATDPVAGRSWKRYAYTRNRKYIQLSSFSRPCLPVS